MKIFTCKYLGILNPYSIFRNNNQIEAIIAHSYDVWVVGEGHCVQLFHDITPGIIPGIVVRLGVSCSGSSRYKYSRLVV